MRFPDCSLHHCEQRSPVWFSLRRGILTASDFGPWLVEKPEVRLTVEEIKDLLSDLRIEPPKKANKPELVALLPNPEKYATLTGKTIEARESAICRLVAETAECWEEPRFESAAMKRGTELEPDAVAAFESATGLKVEPVGFCRSNLGRFGCSPDGLIVGQNAGFEGKVPVPATHIQYRRAGVLPEKYLFQVHGSMAVTGAQAWWFQSYNEKLANFRFLVERNAFTEELKAGLVAFSSDLEKALAEEERAWIAEFGAK